MIRADGGKRKRKCLFATRILVAEIEKLLPERYLLLLIDPPSILSSFENVVLEPAISGAVNDRGCRFTDSEPGAS